jgi:acyl-homoserine-lactone acylase
MIADASPMSFEKMIELKHSTRMELADRILPDLLSAAQGHVRVAAAVAVLEKWDRTADNNSRGGVLFAEWIKQFQPGGTGPVTGLFATQWAESDPRATPKGLADPAKAVAALEAAANETKKMYGRLDVSWGEAHRFRRGGVDLSANGGPGDLLGIFRVINYAQGKDGKQVASGGDSYVGAIEFGRQVKAMVVISYGNATQAGSPHATDQLELISNKKMRPAWRTREEVEKHRVSKQDFE